MRYLYGALLLLSLFILPVSTQAYTSDDFVFTIDTTISAGTAADQFQFCATGVGRNYTINWGDGVTGSYGTSPSFITHTYATSGVKTIVITPNVVGGFPMLCQGSDAAKILTIEQWGTNQWISFVSAFINASNLTITATDVPDLSNVTDLTQMFRGATSLNTDISNWDVSTITSMQGMFDGATAFNQDLSSWDVSNVTNMNSMFARATAFNQDLSAWDVSNVVAFYRMFHQSGWNQSLASWTVRPDADITYMIGSNQFDLPFTSWTWLYNPARTSWRGLLAGANAFSQDISNLVIPSNITDISELFAGNSNFNQDLSAWDVSNITDMRRVFNNASSFNQNISAWDVSNATLMIAMFDGAISFNQDLSAWDVSSVIQMEGMFQSATAFNQNLSTWDVSSATDVSQMFYNATAFNQSLGDWPVQNGTYLESILEDSGITSQNYSATLVGWANRNLMPGSGTNIGDIPSTYCDTAQAARDILVTNGWMISDSGTETCTGEGSTTLTSSGGSSGTMVGVRAERLKEMVSNNPINVSFATFIASVRDFLEYLTENEAEIEKLPAEEQTKVIIALRDIIVFLLRFIPSPT